MQDLVIIVGKDPNEPIKEYSNGLVGNSLKENINQPEPLIQRPFMPTQERIEDHLPLPQTIFAPPPTLDDYKVNPIELPEILNDVAEYKISSLSHDRIATIMRDLVNKILQGWPRSKLIGLMMNNFGIGFDAATNFIDMTFVMIENDLRDELKNQVILSKSRRLEIYRQAMENKDLRIALDCLRDISKLNGEYSGGMDERYTRALENIAGAINGAIAEGGLSDTGADCQDIDVPIDTDYEEI